MSKDLKRYLQITHDHVDGKFLVSLVPIVDTHSSLAPSTQSDGSTFKKKCDEGKFNYDYSRFTYDFRAAICTF